MTLLLGDSSESVFSEYSTTLSILRDNSTRINDKDDVEILTKEQALFIMRILMYGVTPAVSILGVIGNSFSIIILRKHGLHKCSNILLFCLAITDLTFLIAFNSPPKILYEVVGIEYSFEYSKDVSFFLFILYNIFNILDYGMGYTSLTFPMLITLERLVAVYFPFKFQLIVTPARTWGAVALLYILWYSMVIYMSFWVKFDYQFDPAYNISVGKMPRSSMYDETIHTVDAFQMAISYLGMKIPPVFTLVGCIFIGVRIQIASSQRKKMTQANSKEASSNRTTKMLLAVCAIYTVACAVLVLPTYIPQYSYYTIANDAPSNLGKIMYQIINIVVCINSSANFLVYVVMNKNFRDTYKSLFVRRRAAENKSNSGAKTQMTN